MGTEVRPPQPPAPPRPGTSLVALAVLVLAVIVLASALAIWVGLRFLSSNVQVRVEEGSRGQKEVSIRTPVGSLEVQPEVNEAALGLPVYPGAQRVTDKEAATVNLDFPGKENVRILVAKFVTSDAPEKVRDFYKERLGSEVTKFTERTAEGKTVFELKESGQERVVALERKGGGTEIALVRVAHGEGSTN